MAFQFAYDITGDATSVVKDFSLDTAGNYGAGGMKKGDLVTQVSGLVRKATAATTSGTALGVAEGGEFLGLVAAGQPYAATNSSFTASAINTTKNPNGVVKVRNSKATSVFKAPLKAGQTAANANLSVSYGIFVDANNDQQVDLTNTTATLVKVLDYTPDGKYVFVTLT
jgi:hypothetical protein